MHWFNNRFSLGGAVSNLIRKTNKSFYTHARHYYLNASHVLKIGRSFATKTVLVARGVKKVELIQMLVWLSHDKFPVRIGVGFRNTSTLLFGAYGRFKRLYIGYFGDYTNSLFANNNLFSHEIRLGVELFDQRLNQPLDFKGEQRF